MHATERAGVLLERDDDLARLRPAIAAAAEGQGAVVFVTGEAGIGKTSLLRALLSEASGSMRTVVGRCDSLATPRALGPFLDLAGPLGVDHVSDRDRLMGAIVGALRAGPPTLLAIEDAHWADDATVELLTMLGRRMSDLPALMVVTFRDTDVAGDHPLRVAIGDLVTAPTSLWIGLRPLSRQAVAHLADGSQHDPDVLHARTGGNPFFVTEALAAGDQLPATVRLAVLARAARLGPQARDVLDAVAIVPGRAEPWLVETLAGDAAGPLQTCVDAGVIEFEAGGYAFRHELARLAVSSEMPESSRRALHTAALTTLADREGVDPARLAHHALGTGDRHAVAHWSAVALRAAVARTAYREAIRHGEQAITAETDPDTIADLKTQLSRALVTMARPEEAERHAAEAADHWAEVGDDRRRAEALVALSIATAALGNTDASTPPILTAIELLEQQPPGSELAHAYVRMTSLHMLARERDPAVVWGAKAIALATEIGDMEALGRALTEAGIADVMDARFDGLDKVRQAAELGRRHDLPAVVAGALSQIGSGCGEMRRYDLAVEALEEGVPYAAEHHLESPWRYQLSWLARCRFDLGEWDAAERLARQALAGRPTLIARFVALNTLGWLRARRGDDDIWTALDEAQAIARRIGHLQRLWPNAVARAEAGWLEGQLDRHVDTLRPLLDLATRCRHSLAIGEIALWLHRAGAIAAAPPSAAVPFAAWIEGRPLDAAGGLRLIGQPYETAAALADSGEPAALLEALDTFRRLGARPMAARVAAAAGVNLRHGGEHAARTEARSDPRRLSERELEVLRLVAAGYSNPQIAATLFISRKTAEHHVSNILAKLGAATRAEAAVKATESGLIGAGRPPNSDSRHV